MVLLFWLEERHEGQAPLTSDLLPVTFIWHRQISRNEDITTNFKVFGLTRPWELNLGPPVLQADALSTKLTPPNNDLSYFENVIENGAFVPEEQFMILNFVLSTCI